MDLLQIFHYSCHSFLIDLGFFGCKFKLTLANYMGVGGRGNYQRSKKPKTLKPGLEISQNKDKVKKMMGHSEWFHSIKNLDRVMSL